MREPPKDVPTLHISWANLAAGTLLALGWFYGMSELVQWAGTDIGCLDKPGYRGSQFELAMCAIIDGPRGWIILAWFALPFLSLSWWLRKKLGRSRP